MIALLRPFVPSFSFSPRGGRSAVRGVAALALLGAMAGGCSSDDDDDATGTDGGMATDTAATTATSATTGGTATTGSSGGATTGSATTASATSATSSTDTTDTSATTTASGTTAEPGVCPPDPADDACDTCVKANCCEVSQACLADPGCTCFQDCVLAAGGGIGPVQMCGEMCGVSPLTGDGITAQNTMCVAASCFADCA